MPAAQQLLAPKPAMPLHIHYSKTNNLNVYSKNLLFEILSFALRLALTTNFITLIALALVCALALGHSLDCSRSLWVILQLLTPLARGQLIKRQGQGV